MKKHQLLLVAIIFLALFLRLFKLSNIPAGFANDEAAITYQAYSILVTGKDTWGNIIPLFSFKDFGEYLPPFAVYALMKEAVEYARKGNPIMIEAVTYRLGQHTTSDDPTLYRSNEEVEKWKKKDPVKRMQLYMKDNNLWNQDYENEIQSAIKEKVDNAVKEAEAFPKQKPEEFFDYVFKEKTQNLKEQQEYLKRFYK